MIERESRERSNLRFNSVDTKAGKVIILDVRHRFSLERGDLAWYIRPAVCNAPHAHSSSFHPQPVASKPRWIDGERNFCEALGVKRGIHWYLVAEGRTCMRGLESRLGRHKLVVPTAFVSFSLSRITSSGGWAANHLLNHRSSKGGTDCPFMDPSPPSASPSSSGASASTSADSRIALAPRFEDCEVQHLVELIG